MCGYSAVRAPGDPEEANTDGTESKDGLMLSRPPQNYRQRHREKLISLLKSGVFRAGNYIWRSDWLCFLDKSNHTSIVFLLRDPAKHSPKERSGKLLVTCCWSICFLRWLIPFGVAHVHTYSAVGSSGLPTLHVKPEQPKKTPAERANFTLNSRPPAALWVQTLDPHCNHRATVQHNALLMLLNVHNIPLPHSMTILIGEKNTCL